MLDMQKGEQGDVFHGGRGGHHDVLHDVCFDV